MKKINEKEFGLLADEVIRNIAIETEEAVRFIIKDVAKYYNISEDELRKALRLVDSDFVSNNSIIFYNGTKFIKRTSFLSQTLKIVGKVGHKLKKVYGDEKDIDIKFILDIIEHEYS